ncbi:armadillo-type protein [Mycena latifolia]|nr:armadillo-type protein [Mycena latifolia]
MSPDYETTDSDGDDDMDMNDLKVTPKDVLILYDAVGPLADAVGRALQNPRYVKILMPPLTNRWSRLKDDDEDLVPLLECLASVTIAIGITFLPYALPAFQQYPDMEEPDKFLVVVLDLLSGLTQGLGMEMQPLITASQPNLLSLLTVCLKHPQAPVRQSAYALVGPEPKYDFISASNNAAWSVGEVALRHGRDDPEFKQWVNPLIARLIPILLHPKAPRSLHENAAVSIGRIGLTHPDLVAPHLPEFAQAWCQALYEIRDNEEKDSAFRGFCTLVQANPSGIAKPVVSCNAIVRWNQPSPELNEMFQTLLQGFKQHDPTAWTTQIALFPQPIQERLATRYGV